MACRYVLVCQNEDCKQRGSGELLQKLSEKLTGTDDVEVKSYMCFGGCQAGPNIVLYPQKVWYSGVKREDVDDIATHAKGGPPVDRLTHGIDQSLQDLIYQLLDAGLF
jgi:NADH-quinone oxidoreductase subunit F/NADP-reducing hydrogenase subunit HndC